MGKFKPDARDMVEVRKEDVLSAIVFAAEARKEKFFEMICGGEPVGKPPKWMLRFAKALGIRTRPERRGGQGRVKEGPRGLRVATSD